MNLSKEEIELLAKLKNVGHMPRRKRRYISLCPFHKEKTPSFIVDFSAGEFYCLGCCKEGNIETLRSVLLA